MLSFEFKWYLNAVFVFSSYTSSYVFLFYFYNKQVCSFFYSHRVWYYFLRCISLTMTKRPIDSINPFIRVKVCSTSTTPVLNASSTRELRWDSENRRCIKSGHFPLRIAEQRGILAINMRACILLKPNLLVSKELKKLKEVCCRIRSRTLLPMLSDTDKKPRVFTEIRGKIS